MTRDTCDTLHLTLVTRDLSPADPGDLHAGPAPGPRADHRDLARHHLHQRHADRDRGECYLVRRGSLISTTAAAELPRDIPRPADHHDGGEHAGGAHRPHHLHHADPRPRVTSQSVLVMSYLLYV